MQEKDFTQRELKTRPTLAEYYPQYAEASQGKSDFTCCFEGLRYWYHPDYLGSVDMITDDEGKVHQYFLYTPWGEQMYAYTSSNQTYESEYFFNGKEFDEETGLGYYGARYYESQVSSWLSVDALATKEPNINSYAFVGSNPVTYVDPDGSFRIPAAFKERYPLLTKYINNNLLNDVKNCQSIIDGLRRYGVQREEGTYFTDARIDWLFGAGTGPELEFEDFNETGLIGNAQTPSDYILFNTQFLDPIEAALGNENLSDGQKLVFLLAAFITLTHETIHIDENDDGIGQQRGDDYGEFFEAYVWGGGDTEIIRDDDKSNDHLFISELYLAYDSWGRGDIDGQEFIELLRKHGKSDAIPTMLE